MKSYNRILSENLTWAKEVFAKIDEKMSKVSARNRDKVAPDGIDANGAYISRSPANWTSGFFGGLNIMLYEYTKNEEYLKTALAQEKLLDPALWDFEGLYHDVGFMWHILSGAIYRVTGNKDSRNRNLHAAASLYSRFVPDGGFIRAWNNAWQGQAVENWSIVDCMMNVPLLYWASREIGDDRFAQIGMAHADMTMIDHVRDDGSINHIVEHDRESGEMVCSHGGQGFGVGSSWSRGQSWGLYGFILSYIHTKEQRYLDTAKRIAHYFIANCSDDWLPRLDFRAPEEPVFYDSTAGAIAACGLIEIAKAVPEHEAGMYLNAAINILKAMEAKFMNYDPDVDYMLGYGSILYPSDINDPNMVKARTHLPIVYGDYYFTEAILKLLGSEFLPW
ncbi:MAG: glycoside hydrolase family 88 protein [Clostridia bacterium]|nr:glycoside hydrolase family 88 protein [Clostridia bacterium]